MRFLFLGDIVGRPGREAVAAALPALREREGIDFVLANAENASGGLGLSPKCGRELLAAGIDVLTSGNHIWKFRDIPALLAETDRLLRPANFPDPAPGRGVGVYRLPGLAPVAVLNLQGRTFMQPLDCPFAAAERILAALPAEATIRILDFHAEATSEKIALALHLDGRISAVLGTHTHVQTADARLLPKGTAYVTDLGMCGPRDSCLGMEAESIVRRFMTGLPERFEVAAGPVVLQGAIFDIEDSTGTALCIRTWQAGGF
jgi:metallophosphoesterase (TIGR00282 family)